MVAVAAILHKSWRSRPPLSILQSSYLPFPLVDSPGDLSRALHPLPNILMQFIQSEIHIYV